MSCIFPYFCLLQHFTVTSCVRACVFERHTHRERVFVCVCVCVLKGVNCFQGSFSACIHIFFQMRRVCVCVRAVRCSRPCGESSVCSLGVVGRCFLNRPPPGHLCPCLCLKVPISFSFNSPSQLFTLCVCVCVCIHEFFCVPSSDFQLKSPAAVDSLHALPATMNHFFTAVLPQKGHDTPAVKLDQTDIRVN